MQAFVWNIRVVILWCFYLRQDRRGTRHSDKEKAVAGISGNRLLFAFSPVSARYLAYDVEAGLLRREVGVSVPEV